VLFRSDGGYIIAGDTRSYGNDWQAYLIKTDATGKELWSKTFGGTELESGDSVQQTTDGGYIIAGGTGVYDEDLGMQVYLIKTDANGNVGVEEQAGSRQKAVGRITAQPNPFTSFAKVTGHEGEGFKLYDVMGRMVGTYKGDRIGEGLSPGVYFLKPVDTDSKPLRIVKVR
jgi:outer membrane protein assembly factor BamB